MQAIIVWFFIGSQAAAFCTKPMSVEDAEAAQRRLFPAWETSKLPGVTPPSVLRSDHPNYDRARNGDPDAVPFAIKPCKVLDYIE